MLELICFNDMSHSVTFTTGKLYLELSVTDTMCDASPQCLLLVL
jgi:hypothetical protein